MEIVVNATKDCIPDGCTPLSRPGDYYANLLTALGNLALNPPLGELLRLHYQLEGQWLIASPIHWQATHNDAMMVAAGEDLDLSDEESCALFDEVAYFLKGDKFSPVYHDAQTWLFKVDDKPGINSQSVHSLLHQSMMPALDKLDNSLFWQRLITELQMYLSSHRLNLKREGKYPINGLWFWGNGALTISPNKPLLTDDEMLLTLAGNSLPEFTRLEPEAVFRKDHLIIIKDPRQVDFTSLDEKTKKNRVHWYWNNLAYYSQAKTWWSRLWRQ